MSKNCADILMAVIIIYETFVIILMGYSTDIREGFIEIMLVNILTTLLIYLYWMTGLSPMCVATFCTIVFVVGIQFVYDPTDTYPHSLYNIFQRV
jgi:hypothetical protein